ncbi:hypothetical protein BASA84_001496 [Batrachochytrium salamandrivorans]|nr:hypothetical protein BASA84_001496 [Batrachochytrium salamandrivorans]
MFRTTVDDGASSHERRECFEDILHDRDETPSNRPDRPISRKRRERDGEVGSNTKGDLGVPSKRNKLGGSTKATPSESDGREFDRQSSQSSSGSEPTRTRISFIPHQFGDHGHSDAHSVDYCAASDGDTSNYTKSVSSGKGPLRKTLSDLQSDRGSLSGTTSHHSTKSGVDTPKADQTRKKCDCFMRAHAPTDEDGGSFSYLEKCPSTKSSLSQLINHTLDLIKSEEWMPIHSLL